MNEEEKSLVKRILSLVESDYIGIDFLGFPKFIEHYKTEGIVLRNKYFKPYSKK